MRRTPAAAHRGALLLAFSCCVACGSKAPEASSDGAASTDGATVAADANKTSQVDASPVETRADAAADAAQASCAVPANLPDAWMSMGLSVDRPVVDPPPADGIFRVTAFTADSFFDLQERGVRYWGYYGNADTGERGVLSFAGDPALTTDSVVGATVAYAAWSRPLDCLADTAPNTEPEWTAGGVLRDAQGTLLFVRAGTATTDDGTVAYASELLPELTLRAVPVPGETCRFLQRALELTVVATEQAIAVQWGERAEVLIGGEPYVLAVNAIDNPPPGICRPSSWVLYRKSFVHGVQ